MWDSFLRYSPELLKGLSTTLILSASALIASFILSITLTILLTSKNRVLSSIIKSYLVVFTGTPLLVQIFIIYYGPTQFAFIREQLPWVWSVISQPWVCAFLALTLNGAAYTTQIFYGALKSVPDGQWQACAALGMKKKQTLKVVIPYALKRALSSYSNEVIFMVKGTALTSTITLLDLMGYSNYLIGRDYNFSIFIIVGAIYLLINGILSTIMRIIERKMLIFE